MNAIVAINAYKKIGVESKVTGAEPHQLISMLYHGALAAIANAKDGMEHKDIEAKGRSISKAIAIIGEGLHASLDKKIGGRWRSKCRPYTTTWSDGCLMPICTMTRQHLMRWFAC